MCRPAASSDPAGRLSNTCNIDRFAFLTHNLISFQNKIDIRSLREMLMSIRFVFRFA